MAVLFSPSSVSSVSSMAGGGRRWLCSGIGDVFSGQTAYEVLGVPETSSFSEIKASFRKLAKETHPDVSPISEPSVASHRFLKILAAYEILSDSEKRADYDSFLFSQRQILEKQPGVGSSPVYAYRHSSYVAVPKQADVVEWLEWYRLAVGDVISQRKVASGTGYFGELENELYSAIRAAYYGPVIESAGHLPDSFEAEERSGEQTLEVLHLVSGRDLLGIVYIADSVPRLSHGSVGKLDSSSLKCPQPRQSHEDINTKIISVSPEGFDSNEFHGGHCDDHLPDAYRELEVYISGRLIATATRDPPGDHHIKNATAGCSEDCIRVFLGSSRDKAERREIDPAGVMPYTTVGTSNLLGTIRGLGTTSEEGSCYVYDNNGAKTHVIMKHRTLLVKHMHWYAIGEEIATCECRCSRARLPPSRFWLFEPRSCMHDIGGWYVETFGRDKRGRTTPSKREWDGTMEHNEKRLHPAMYLVALAYKTLDLEFAKRQKRPLRDIVGSTVSNLFHWCKRLV
ncbi:unnamed protein product [Spirodela intermedia]|uniref:J domain-containing protein n=1 Tax=Spirodela intermedia TaxID=51605 RepID=A0A7I8K7F0_SPIIN|nr:unnamed protein product [Spirodela intermedia]